MSINSAAFLLFLAVSALLYYVVPKRVRWVVLLSASAAFYLLYSVRAAFYLLCTVGLTYGAGRILGGLHENEGERLAEQGADKKAVRQAFKHRRRVVLAAVLVVNFATLAVFKYLDSWRADFAFLAGLLGRSAVVRPLGLLLPLGISFYIFQTSGYLIDVYRGREKPERNFLKYALFACYFPQMIQGPINRFGKLAPQLFEGNDFRAENLKYGIELMLWGLLKKVFLADPLAGAVSEVYSDFTAYPGAVSLIGAALYCIELYCDFSGGVDLVRGASMLFGVRMEENFRRPYFSRTLDEFWRRWHISLGEWMKDYLFYPLALSAPLSKLGKSARKHLGAYVGKLAVPAVSTLAVFLVVGIWQGPGLANIAYGLWNGGLMSLAMLFEKPFSSLRAKLRVKGDEGWFHAFGIARTCCLVLIGRYFSRADSLLQALRMLWRTVRYFGTGWAGAGTLLSFGMTPRAWALCAFAGLVLLAVSLCGERGISVRELLDRMPRALQFAAVFSAVLLLVVFAYLNTDYTAVGYVYENI